MTTTRRSTRLLAIDADNHNSSELAAATSISELPKTPRSRRHAEIWRHRSQHKTTTSAVSSDVEEESADDDDNANGVHGKNQNRLNKNRPNKENDNLINKQDTITTTTKMVGKKNISELKKNLRQSVPASRKRQIALNLTKSDENVSDTEEYKSDCDLDTRNSSASNAVNVSPPKQARGQRHTQQKNKLLQSVLISPSRLIDRLSMDDKEEIDEAVNNTDRSSGTPEHVETAESTSTEVTGKTTIASPQRNKYQNARRVLNSAETQNLPGREEQLQQLRAFFLDHLNEEKSGSLYVSGQPGTGKTACLSLLLKSQEISRRLQCAYINCTSIASIGNVYKKLCTELKIHVTGRTERDHLEAIQKHLRRSDRMVLIVLDEIDQLCSGRQSVLYTIFEWPALQGVRLLLVGIANSLDLTDRALTRLNARCELKPTLMHFPPYSKQQIIDIFRTRLKEAGVLDVFPAVTIQLLAAKVSSVNGDVRRALDIGRRVVEIAEQQKRAGHHEVDLKDLKDIVSSANNNDQTDEAVKPVQMKQVVEVLNKVYGTSQNLDEDIQDAFPLQQKLMLCSLMLMLRNERNKDINIGRLHEVYRRVCSKRNIHILDQAEFAGTVDLVETRGILRVIGKKERRLSKIHLQWDEDEVNAALSDKQLIASILDDVSCLHPNGNGRK